VKAASSWLVVQVVGDFARNKIRAFGLNALQNAPPVIVASAASTCLRRGRNASCCCWQGRCCGGRRRGQPIGGGGCGVDACSRLRRLTETPNSVDRYNDGKRCRDAILTNVRGGAGGS